MNLLLCAVERDRERHGESPAPVADPFAEVEAGRLTGGTA